MPAGRHRSHRGCVAGRSVEVAVAEGEIFAANFVFFAVQHFAMVRQHA